MKNLLITIAAICFATSAFADRDDYRRGDGNSRQKAVQISQRISQNASELARQISRATHRGTSLTHEARGISRLSSEISYSLQRRGRADSVKRQVRSLRSKITNFTSSVRRNPRLRYNYQIKDRTQRLQNQISRLVSAVRSIGNGGGSGGRGSFRCVAVDRGWEEHRGGHTATARGQFQAERTALQACQRFHGSCRILRCSAF